MIEPTLHQDITTYGDVRYKILTKFENAIAHEANQWGEYTDMYESLKDGMRSIKHTGDFQSLFEYFKRCEDSSSMNFLMWLKDYGVITYDNEWYETFRPLSIPARPALYAQMFERWHKEMTNRFHGFGDEEMEVLDI